MRSITIKLDNGNCYKVSFVNKVCTDITSSLSNYYVSQDFFERVKEKRLARKLAEEQLGSVVIEVIDE